MTSHPQVPTQEIDQVHSKLEQGLSLLGLRDCADTLMAYVNLLYKWNQTYNLTSVRAISEMIPRHILDSLAILPSLKGSRILDVGSGGGLPGIPIAIARPDLAVTLLDSNGKKTRFLQAVKRTLGLSQVEVVHSRAESYVVKPGFDTVVSRAFTQLSQMIAWTEHLVVKGGIWLAMKGVYPAHELEALRLPYDVKKYDFAGIDAERCCIIIYKE